MVQSMIPHSLMKRQTRILSHQSPLRKKHSKNNSPAKNFLAQNMKNISEYERDKLHPNFSVCTNSNGGNKDVLSKGTIEDNYEQEQDQKSSELKRFEASEQKKALIVEVQKRINVQSEFNANEILYAAGITNHRIKEAQDKMSQKQMSGSVEELEQNLPRQTKAQVKEQTVAVATIITSAEKVKELNSMENERQVNAKKMIGKTRYKIPDSLKLESYLHGVKSADKRTMITGLASGERSLEGKITLKDYDKKMERVKEGQLDPIMEHVKKFAGKKGIAGLSLIEK